jgi:AhpD family alkylhydroperoxidase
MSTNVSPRIDVRKVAPQDLEPVAAVERYIHTLGFEERFIELIKLRASQMNGCAFCVDLHARRLRELGEPNERIDAVAAWSEGPFFDSRERAALAWTESVTELSRDHVPDSVYELARAEFDEAELVHLTLVIAVINVWNRIAVPFRSVPEGYHRIRQAGG